MSPKSARPAPKRAAKSPSPSAGPATQDDEGTGPETAGKSPEPDASSSRASAADPEGGDSGKAAAGKRVTRSASQKPADKPAQKPIPPKAVTKIIKRKPIPNWNPKTGYPKPEAESSKPKAEAPKTKAGPSKPKAEASKPKPATGDDDALVDVANAPAGDAPPKAAKPKTKPATDAAAPTGIGKDSAPTLRQKRRAKLWRDALMQQINLFSVDSGLPRRLTAPIVVDLKVAWQKLSDIAGEDEDDRE